MDDMVTVVGENTVVKGSLQGDENLTVFGRVEGTINLSKTLIVESSGIVLADVEVQDAIVSGVVVGNITATNSVQLTEEGRVVGDLSAPRCIIVDGASFRGHVDMGDLETPKARAGLAPAPSRPAARMTPVRPRAPAPVPRKPEPSPREARPKPPARPEPQKANKTTTKKREAASSGARSRKPPRPPSIPRGKRRVRRK